MNFNLIVNAIEMPKHDVEEEAQRWGGRDVGLDISYVTLTCKHHTNTKDISHEKALLSLRP